MSYRRGACCPEQGERPWGAQGPRPVPRESWHSAKGQADPRPSLGRGRVPGQGMLASLWRSILILLFSLIFTGLFKDSSPNPVRDDAFLPKQSVGRVFSGGWGVVNCRWRAIILSAGGRLPLTSLCWPSHFGFVVVWCCWSFAEVPPPERAGLSVTRQYCCCCLQMTMFFKS